VGQKAQRASFYATRKAKVKVGEQELTAQWHQRAGERLETLRDMATTSQRFEATFTAYPAGGLTGSLPIAQQSG
jgi:hypothetical protein